MSIKKMKCSKEELIIYKRMLLRLFSNLGAQIMQNIK